MEAGAEWPVRHGGSSGGGGGPRARSLTWRGHKVGYAAPLDEWARGPLHDWMFERVFEGPITDVPGYDRAAITGL